MPVDAFLVDEKTEDSTREFIYTFIHSNNFTNSERKSICDSLKLSFNSNENKEALTTIITNSVFNGMKNNNPLPAQVVMKKLIQRNNSYVAIKVGNISKFPRKKRPELLVFSRGENDWYGPIEETENEAWYIRTFLFPYEETKFYENIGTQTKSYVIRWYCLVRVTSSDVAIFWRNFTTGGQDGGQMIMGNAVFSGRFPYWQYIPKVFDNIEKLFGAELSEINLESIVLHSLWDSLRYQENIKWDDIRIRAEHKGVALNAQGNTRISSSDEDIETTELNITGIKYLATTIREVLQKRLLQKYTFDIPYIDHTYFDEEILRTLIQRYNPKSYRCLIQNENDYVLFSADCYFGKLSNSNSADKFIHLHLYDVNYIDQTQQLQFILQYQNKPTKTEDDTNQRKLL